MPDDTSPEARRVQTEIYRRMPPARRWWLLGQMYHHARTLHAAGVRLRNPAATASDIQASWVSLTLGKTLASVCRPGEWQMNSSEENARVMLEVAGAFARLQIPCALGGSQASSM